nr:hypothetical protein [Tanacetum cinerariifolium]
RGGGHYHGVALYPVAGSAAEGKVGERAGVAAAQVIHGVQAGVGAAGRALVQVKISCQAGGGDGGGGQHVGPHLGGGSGHVVPAVGEVAHVYDEVIGPPVVDKLALGAEAQGIYL